ncbi:R-SNARE protein, Sec22-family [Coccomyxa subellipsoidea C-169]|uniref:R-SNARE protein, Sec22-family n=1 Tax=Coccomyxa subellipsoidea (strain C-169) TaxID=574566 RepID=I0YUT9_COCSC|nr:R-SNARE protein, Sec22-family [Coccomyxa subellipsoidea C-169]EIE22158.1 R-SNARE protein, Sec22-family [Coccomyxa subellipsoidea C-169]|eukprot:XP_005646702.1 R-SNARE protein, Sec22-family [Coccomyxa subellipsoidea C-169]
MVRLTLIARVHDGLPLAEGLDGEKDRDLETYKHQAKTLFKRMAKENPANSRMSVDSGPFVFHYIIQGGVCYLTLTDKSYPKKLAYQYLEELQSEFTGLYGSQIESAARPYAFIKFDTFISKTKKLYMDTRTQRNISKLTEDLSEVHNIMTRNIADVLGQGERLDRMSQKSAQLTSESKQYAQRSKDLYRQALIRKYMPVAVIIGVLVFVLWVRSYFYGRR